MRKWLLRILRTDPEATLLILFSHVAGTWCIFFISTTVLKNDRNFKIKELWDSPKQGGVMLGNNYGLGFEVRCKQVEWCKGSSGSLLFKVDFFLEPQWTIDLFIICLRHYGDLKGDGSQSDPCHVETLALYPNRLRPNGHMPFPTLLLLMSPSATMATPSGESTQATFSCVYSPVGHCKPRHKSLSWKRKKALFK